MHRTLSTCVIRFAYHMPAVTLAQININVLRKVTALFYPSELRVHRYRSVHQRQKEFSHKVFVIAHVMCAPTFRSALPPIREPISSTFLSAHRGIFLDFVKSTISDVSRVPEFLVHFSEFDI